MNKVKMVKHWFTLLCLLLISVSNVSAQRNNLDSLKFINEARSTLTIKDAYKIKDKPEYTDTVKKIPALSYPIIPKQVKTSFQPEEIKQAKMVGEPLTKLYKALLKAGMGTYTTPYGEIWLNSLRSKEYAYGIRAKHLSSSATLGGLGYSGYSDNEISAFGKKYVGKQVLWGNFDYTRNVVHYYGYDTTQYKISDYDAIKQRFNYISGQIGLRSFHTDTNKINHDIRIGYYNLADFYKVSENNFLVDINIGGYIKKIQPFNMNASVDYYNNRLTHDTINNAIIKLNPSFSGNGKIWKGEIGMVGFLDRLHDTTKFYFTPQLNVSFNVIDNILIPYLGLKGGLQKNSYRTLSLANPFILSDIRFRNSYTRYEVFAGLKGAISRATTYDMSVYYSETDNTALYVNTFVLNNMNNRFDVVYDYIKLFRAHGEFIYEKSEKLKILGKGNYYGYNTREEQKAWHKPLYDVTLSANYNLKSKIIFKGDVFYIGKQFAKTFDAKNNVVAKELKGIADINIGAEYRYTKLLSGYLNFNNIGSFRYYRWNNYPLQRFNMMLGITLSF